MLLEESVSRNLLLKLYSFYNVFFFQECLFPTRVEINTQDLFWLFIPKHKKYKSTFTFIFKYLLFLHTIQIDWGSE